MRSKIVFRLSARPGCLNVEVRARCADSIGEHCAARLMLALKQPFLKVRGHRLGGGTGGDGAQASGCPDVMAKSSARPARGGHTTAPSLRLQRAINGKNGLRLSARRSTGRTSRLSDLHRTDDLSKVGGRLVEKHKVRDDGAWARRLIDLLRSNRQSTKKNEN